jgi:hypothetical protein
MICIKLLGEEENSQVYVELANPVLTFQQFCFKAVATPRDPHPHGR